MNIVLQIFILASLLIFLLCIVRFLVKKQLNIKYSLVWLASTVGMIVITLFPRLVDIAGDLVGVAAPVNTIFLFGCIFMAMIIFSLTVIISRLSQRLRNLTQEMALLEKRVREGERE